MWCMSKWVHSSTNSDFCVDNVVRFIAFSFLLLLDNVDCHTVDFQLHSKIFRWSLDIGGSLQVVNVMSIDNNFLSKINLTFESNLVWW